MKDLSEDLSALRRRLDEAAAYLDIETTRKRLAEIEGCGGLVDRKSTRLNSSH